MWRKDGRELFFMSLDNFIYSVDLAKLSSAHTVAAPVKPFRACPQTIPSQAAGSNASYFYTFETRDRNRFLMDCRVDAPGHFVVLLDAVGR